MSTISEYADKVLPYWTKWSKSYSYQSVRLEDLHKEALHLYSKSNVPRTRLGSSLNLGFDSSKWEIEVGTSGYDMENGIPLDQFLNEVELIYLSACYAEQYWLSVLKALAPQVGKCRPDFIGLSRSLKVSYSVLDQAWALVSKSSGQSLASYANLPVVDYESIKVALRKALLGEQIGNVKVLSYGTRHTLPAQPIEGALYFGSPHIAKAKGKLAQASASPNANLGIAKTNAVDIKQHFAPLEFVVTTMGRSKPKSAPILVNRAVESFVSPFKTEVAEFIPRTGEAAKAYATSSFVAPSAPVLSIVGVTYAPAVKVNIESEKYDRWPKLMMTDLEIVKEFVRQTVHCWEKWKDWGATGFSSAHAPSKRVYTLQDIVKNIHRRCGIPTTAFRTVSNTRNTKGTFSPASWSIEINMYPLIKNKDLDAIDFLDVMETVYHEARHTEQEWILLVQWFFENRIELTAGVYHVDDSIVRDVLSKTKIDRSIIDEALAAALARPKVPLGSSGKPRVGYKLFTDMVNAWRDSNYTTGKLETNDIYRRLDSGDHHVYHKYRHLPEEADAFYIQGYIRDEFAKNNDFRRVIPLLSSVNPPNCSHCR